MYKVTNKSSEAVSTEISTPTEARKTVVIAARGFVMALEVSPLVRSQASTGLLRVERVPAAGVLRAPQKAIRTSYNSDD